MEQAKVPYRKIVFVCVNKREPNEVCCSQRDSDAIAASIKERIKAAGLACHVRVSRSGCQDLCAKGPNVMVFPDYVWYQGVTPADVDRIVEEVRQGIEPPTAHV